MALKSVSIYNLVVVLVGNFNPSIITPSWLALKKLIRDSEAENADVDVIHPELSRFSLSFVEINVNRERFELKCENQADFHLVRDLASSIFSILNETPIKGIGLNHILHYSLTNDKTYRKFGEWLTPLDIWTDDLKTPKLLELKITEPINKDSAITNQVTINSSKKIKPYGVCMILNYHIEAANNPNSSPNKLIMENWDGSFEKVDNVYNNIMKKFNDGNR